MKNGDGSDGREDCWANEQIKQRLTEELIILISRKPLCV